MRFNNVEKAKRLFELDISNPYSSVLMLWYCVCYIRNEIPENQDCQFDRIHPANRLLFSIALCVLTYKKLSADRVANSVAEKVIDELLVIAENAFGISQPSQSLRSNLDKHNYYSLKAKMVSVCGKVSIPTELDYVAIAELILHCAEVPIEANAVFGLSSQLNNICNQASSACLEVISKKSSDNQSNERLIASVLDALNVLSTDDEYLLRNSLSERCISHRLAVILSNKFPEYDVDVEYNRFKGEPKSIDIYKEDVSRALKIDGGSLESGGHKNVYPDIIIHKRGFPVNIAAFEIKRKSQCSELQRLFDIYKLKKYCEVTNALKYSNAVFINLDDSPDGLIFKHDVEIYQDGSLVFSNRDDVLIHNYQTEWKLGIFDPDEEPNRRDFLMNLIKRKTRTL